MKKIIFASLLLASATTVLSQCQDPVSVAYVQNFNGLTAPFLPECTYSAQSTFGGNDWESAAAPGTGFDDMVLRFNTASQNEWTISANYYTRLLQLNQGVNYKISYKYAHAGNPGSINSLAVRVINNNEGGSAEVAIHENITSTDITTYISGEFTVAVSGSYTLQFDITSSPNQGMLYLDDIAVEEWNCNAPENVAVANITMTGADISWTAADGEGTVPYQYSILPVAEGTLTGGQTDALTATANTLEPGTSYEVYVRVFCSGAWSTWSTPVTFTTEQEIMGNNETLFNNFNFYPNPATSMITIINPNGIDTVELYAVTGQRVLSQKGSESENTILNIEALAAGAYLLKIQSGDQTKKIKFLKN